MPYQKILAGVDGSETALAALSHAADLAKAQGSELLILCAYRPPDPRTVDSWKNEAPGDFQWRITEHAVADSVLEKALQAVAGVEVNARTRSEVGDPAEVIVEVAKEEGVDLIVVGNRGMSSSKRFVLGSVPNNISHHAPCDLLIADTT